jgi:hypothetical protein
LLYCEHKYKIFKKSDLQIQRTDLPMIEKTYKSYKYIDCHCSRHDQIQVGVDGYKYLNSIAILGGLAITFIIVFSQISLQASLFAIFLFGLPATVAPLYNFLETKRIMLLAGHSESCSRRVAFMYMLRASIWSEFRIMKEKDDSRRW